MGKLTPFGQNRFDGGMSDDLRGDTPTNYGATKHFDVFSSPNKLIPYRSTEAEADGTSAANLGTYDLRHFTLGKNGLMYALGVSSTFPQVMQKTDPTTGTWSVATTAIGNAVRINGCFIEWAGAFWMFSGTTNVSKWTIGGTFTNTVATIATAVTTVAQGVVGADNNLYLFYNNQVVRVSSAGAVTDAVMTAIPADMRIVSACRYGSYIAIGCAYGTSATASPTGRSQVFIWDMVTDTTVADVLDWGEGALTVLGNVEGRVVGVSNKYLETPSGLTSLAVGGGAMVVRMWQGGEPQVYKEIVANQSVTLGRFIRDVVVKNNKMYWVASVPFHNSTSTESTYNLGIWAFGRKNIGGNFGLSLDYIEEGVDTSNYKIISFGSAGNYWFINHGASGLVNKTDDAANYTFTSIFESNKIGNSRSKKKLIGVFVNTVYLPAAGQVVLKYLKDEETSWTTIFTNSTDNSLSHSAINIESSGATLPEFRELQLRIESTGGAEITAYGGIYEELDKEVVKYG